jgi:hypothetical protein
MCNHRVDATAEVEMAGELGKLRDIWNYAAAYLRDRRRCAEIRNDLQALGPDERRRIFGEYDLTPEDFDMALRIPFASEDMSSWALRSVGVDPQQFHREHGVRSRIMRRACTMCHLKARCRKDLMAGSFERNHRDYCPNRSHFAVLLARRAYQSSAAGRIRN